MLEEVSRMRIVWGYNLSDFYKMKPICGEAFKSSGNMDSSNCLNL